MKNTKFAHVGSCIQTTFSDGRKYTIKVTTPRQCAEANELIMTGRWKALDIVKEQPEDSHNG